MTDEEFVAMEPPAAQAALANIPDEGERSRLRSVYARTRGMLVDGTGQRNTPKYDPARGVRAAPQIQPAAEVAGSVSGMLAGGRIIFWIGVAIGVIAAIMLVASGSSSDEIGRGGLAAALLGLYAASVLLGLGGFMWMLGAIEQRLIEIREILNKSTPG